MVAPRVAVVQGSLTDGDETLLVNASNTNVMLGSGVSGAIRAACGPGYQAHIEAAMRVRFGGPMEPGQVLVTDAGSHPRARWVAHVAVMDYRAGMTARSFPTLEIITRGCVNLFEEIEALPPEPDVALTVAMVGLGAGTGQLGVREPTRVACEALTRHLARAPQTRIRGVTFYGYLLFEYLAMVDVVRGLFPDAVVPLRLRE